MCGIAGQVMVSRAGEVDGLDVARMTRAIAHRGPDGEGFFTDRHGRVALGMRRLAIIDLVTGEQPVFNEDRTVACVFNGEIYNYRALRAELEARGHVFRSHSDTEAIVHLYEDHGAKCLERLRGMFALAVWDGRDGSVLIARDRLGKKPLYYTEIEGRLCFASEIHALYELPGLRKQIDPAALCLYLAHSYIPGPRSVFRSIRKLPPGHCMTISDGMVSVEPYWHLTCGEPFDASRDEIARALRDKLEESVGLRLVSDVPLGCFLSGGVDSSSVVALMSRLSRDPVKTFSIGFTSERFNELPYARAVARRFRTEHQEFVVEPDAVAVLPEMARHFGEPFGDSSALPTWYLSQLARQHVTVALNGDGGDELFGGYPWYRSALRLGMTGRWLPAWLTGAVSRSGPWTGNRVSRLGRRLRMAPGERFASLRQLVEADMLARLVSRRMLDEVGREVEDHLVRTYRMGQGDDLTKMQYTDIRTYLADDLLVKVDRMTMAHSLEARSPLLDHELLEFSMRIPSAMKLGGSGGKQILRQAMGDLFPPGFFDRRKMGFSIPLAGWLRGPLRERSEQLGRSERLAACGLELGGVRRLVDDHMSHRTDGSAAIWNLMMLREWADAYVG